MDQQQYCDGILEGCRGEILAGAALEELCRQRGPQSERFNDIARLARLERHMAQVLKPLMRKYDLPFPDEPKIEAEGRAMAPAFGDWAQMMEMLQGIMPDVVKQYDALLENARPGDEAILDAFARHERALLNLCLAGNEAAEQAAFREVDDLLAIPC